MQKTPKPEKFNYERMKTDATSANPAIRAKAFKEYFEQFEEFPSYLFNNDHSIDRELYQTIQDLTKDPETSKSMHKGIASLLQRLPSMENMPHFGNT